jgi:hypothetical protein
MCCQNWALATGPSWTVVSENLLFGEQRIYGLALVSFVFLYGLDHF